ncbi:MAG: tyrosine-type recombinase/integrase [Anaerolineae bacterium]|nr:tyrosine-type recombinase/integrase [Anaerolineae bacterium]
MSPKGIRNLNWADMEKDTIPLETLVGQFNVYNQIEGKSRKTRDWYEESLNQFQAYLEAEGLPARLGGIGIQEVRGFVLYLQSKDKWDGHPTTPCRGVGLSAISVGTRVRAIRAFFAWLHREGFTEEDLPAELKVPKAPQKLAPVLAKEIESLIGAIDRDTASGARNLAILTMLLDTGLRLSEVADPEIGNVLFESGYVRALGKGGKERIAPLGATVSSALQRYICYFRGEPAYPGIERTCSSPLGAGSRSRPFGWRRGGRSRAGGSAGRGPTRGRWERSMRRFSTTWKCTCGCWRRSIRPDRGGPWGDQAPTRAFSCGPARVLMRAQVAPPWKVW